MRTFKIPSVPPTTMKCVRFPNDVIEDVEALIVGKDCTFSAFVVEAVRVAVEAVRLEVSDGGAAHAETPREGK